MADVPDGVDLSVVIAATDAARSVVDCLAHLRAACVELSAELILVDASADGTAAIAARPPDPPAILRRPVGTLTPVLWADGYRHSRGRVVAFTTAHCLASPGWAAALLAAIENGATGAGGPLVLAHDSSPLDWAVFFLRYSAFMPHVLAAGRTDGELAGDNAAYLRAALDRHRASIADGFWELDFHRLIRAEGGWLAVAPDARMAFGRSFPPAVILGHRFAHGRRFGASRAAAGGRRRWQIVAAAPLVPAVLWARAARRVFGGGTDRTRFAVATPWFLLLAGAWALGEARGALSARRQAHG